MRKKRNDFDAVGAERMTDTELSKKLGSYQRTESIVLTDSFNQFLCKCLF